MLILLFLPISDCLAASFDTRLYSEISEKGIYNGSDGLIYAAELENRTLLAVMSINISSFDISVFGSDDEIADTLSISLKPKTKYRFNITPRDSEFCFAVTEGDKTRFYSLINDAFTVSEKPPLRLIELASYDGKKMNVKADPFDVYEVLNSIKYSRIETLPLERAALSDEDTDTIQQLLGACSDIYEYSSEDSDNDSLMLRVLYAYTGFMPLSSLPPLHGGENENHMLSAAFIDDVMQKAFRVTPSKPAVNMLTELKYCYNNGYYYYTGGYSGYYSTVINEITDIFKLSDTELFIVFNDTFTDSARNRITEYSTAVTAHDENGFYLKNLRMGKDLEVPQSRDVTRADSEKGVFRRFMPYVILSLALAAVVIAVRVYLF